MASVIYIMQCSAFVGCCCKRALQYLPPVKKTYPVLFKNIKPLYMIRKIYLCFLSLALLLLVSYTQAQPNICSGNCLKLATGTYANAVGGDATKYNNLSAITIQAWIYPTSFPSGNGAPMHIVSKYDHFSVTNSQFSLAFYKQGGVDYLSCLLFVGGVRYTLYAPVAGNISLNTWSHVAVAWQSGMSPVFTINGNSVGTTTYTPITGTIHSSSASPIVFGVTNSDVEYSYEGYIDEVQIYNTYIQPSYIAANRNNTAFGSPYYGNLLGYWRFQNPNGSANEISPNTPVTLSNAGYASTITPCEVPDFGPVTYTATFNPIFGLTNLQITYNPPYPVGDPQSSRGRLKYEIYRNGVYLTQVNAAYGTISYNDNAITKCSNTYYIKLVWGLDNTTTNLFTGPISDTVTAPGFDFGFRASDGTYINKTVLTWPNMNAAGSNGFEIRRDGQLIAYLTNPNATSYTDLDGTPGRRYSYGLKPLNNSAYPVIVCDDQGWIKENGRLSGYVRSPLNAAVPNVTVTATGTVLGQTYTYSDTTDASGFYEIRNVYYDEEATYTLTPSKGTHQFNPPSLERTLDLLAFNAPQANFIDTSVFTVAGKVYFPNQLGAQGCADAGVKILVNGNDIGIVTDAQGNFAYTAQEEGNYTFKPVYPNHTFLPVSVTQHIVDNTSGINFKDVTTDSLWIDLKGYCNTQIADSFKVHIEGGTAGCYTRDIFVQGNTLDGLGLTLPAQQYSVELTAVYANNANTETAIVNSFQSLGNKLRHVDLRNRDSIVQTNVVVQSTTITSDTLTLGNGQIVISSDTAYTYDTTTVITRPAAQARYIYGGRLSLELIGIEPTCGSNIVFTQGNLYNVRVRVWRNYNYMGNQSCPVDTGKITIFDDVSDSSFVYFTLDTFFINYKINPGIPNISASGTHPYQKFISIYATTWDAIGADTSVWATVTGNKSLTSTFITKTPELPMFILHDPMGDGSSATLEQGTSLSYNYSTAIEEGTSTNSYATVSLGAEIPVPFTGIVMNIGGSLGATLSSSDVNTSNNSVNTTFTMLNSYSTSDNDNFIGEDADLVVGGSLNMIYGLSYIVKINENTCIVDLDTALTWGAQDFATTYSYTIGHIKNTLIPQLNFLIGFYHNLGSDSALIYQNYKNVWQQVIDKNHANVTNADFIENRSFSGGVTYTYSSAYENSNTMSISYQTSLDPGVAATLNAGTEQNNVVAGTEVNFLWNTTKTTDSTITNSKSVSYTLNDKDPGDFFSIDVKRDKVYGTPAFKLVSGTSSCPHEDGTQLRDMPEILVQNPNVQNVPINTQATLTVQMSNFSESQETRTYNVIVDPNSNLDGAVVRLSGQVITQAPAVFTIPANTSIFATLSVEAGPVAVDYNNLKLIIYSPCDPDINDEALFTVGFQSSCSDITLFTPSNNWLVNASSNILRVTYGGYNVNDTALLQVGIEMRRAGFGWSTIASSLVSRTQLAQNGLPYYAVDLDFGSLADGPYEIRAYADCASSGTRSYSAPLSGVIDRTSITLLGTPSPTDGVLNVNEEVSVTFSEDIDCSHFFNLQSLVPYAVTLVRADNGDAVPFTYVCAGNKIIFTIAGGVLASLQNVLLTASVSGFYDVNGNILSHPIVWSFVVNNSLVFWQPSGVNASVATGGTSAFTATLKNVSLNTEVFTLSSIPSWLSPTNVPASIAQGASLNINFNISGTGLNPGNYTDTVYADFTGLGVQQPLYIQLTVYANSPTWTVVTKPSQMNIIANFSLTGANAPLSIDANDRIGVFVGSECRGVANIQYTPAGNSYAAYITAYGNNSAVPQEVFEFRMWDAGTATEYKALETQTFVENAQVGQPLAPMILHPAGVVQRIELTAGWNWVSIYLVPNNPNVNDIMKYTANAAGNIIKTNDSYAQAAANGSWSGTLQQISWQKGYQIMVNTATELQVIGQRITDTLAVPVLSGWNWIGYPYETIGTVADYMHTFGSVSSDVLQSSTQFSTFAGGVWNGSLQNMQPGRGYKLKSANSGNILVEPRSVPNWNPDIFGNEFNMNVTAVVKANGAEQMGNFVVGAFINGTCVGVSTPQFAGSSPRVFLTLHGQTADNGSSLQFLIYDYNTDSVYTPLYAAINFTTDAQQGSIENAYELNIESPLAIQPVPAKGKFVLHQNIPNPFNGNTMIRIDMPQEEQVTLQVFDFTGNLVAEPYAGKLTQGSHTIQFNPESLSAGMYFYRMQAGGFIATKKMMIQ